jgi:hypothetical protein
MAANEVATGAAAGAAAGSVVPGIGTAIGAAIGALGGYLTSSSKRKAEKKYRHRVRRAQRLLKPGRIVADAQRVQPKFREMVAGGIGPGIEQRVASNLSRSGFSDTGTGEAVRALSLNLPGQIASQGALSFTAQANQARAENMLGGAAQAPTESGWMAALAGGLQGGLGTFMNMQGQQNHSLADLRLAFPSLRPGTAPAPQFPTIPGFTPPPIQLNRPRVPIF